MIKYGSYIKNMFLLPTPSKCNQHKAPYRNPQGNSYKIQPNSDGQI